MQANEPAAPPTPHQTSQSLLVALMRILQLIKRVDAGSVEPALVWVLHVVKQTQPTRISDLAGHMHLDLSTASRHVSALEASGHLARTADPDDRRASLISLTDAGRDVLHHVFAARCARLGAVLQDWSTSDLQDFEQLLVRLADDLEHPPEGTAPS